MSWSLPAQGPEPRDLELFLLVGQSNMAGRGVIGPDDREALPAIWVQSKDLSWKPAVDPLHYDKPDIAAAGLGRSFAKAVAKARPGASIGLIPAAFGGSALDEWKPGAAHYNEAIRRTRAALKSGRLRGILWHQGEADSKDEVLARSYAQRFETFIQQLRSDLGAADVPVIVGELGRFYRSRPNDGAKFAEIVNAQLKRLSKSVKRCAFVSSSDLTDKGDSVHFDTRSLHEFGERYAAAFLKLDPTWKQKTGVWKRSTSALAYAPDPLPATRS